MRFLSNPLYMLICGVGDDVIAHFVTAQAPDGKFPAHVDHCDGSLVYLMTLGCTAHFMVKAPGMEATHHFDLVSGDMLVFDASTGANVQHAVTGIKEGSCPVHLAEKSAMLKRHRYGVQCRVRF